jgi:hypothetical protein
VRFTRMAEKGVQAQLIWGPITAHEAQGISRLFGAELGHL